MVRLHVKYGEGDGEEEFLYDSQSSAQIEGVLREILQIANLQLKIDRLALELEPQLAPLYGDQKAVGLIRALSEAKAYASKDQVLHGKPLLYHALKDHFQVLEKELNSSYQLLGFSDSEQLQKLSASVEQYEIGNTHLHWAGKELLRDKQLCYYIGKNKKTKITVRVQSDGLFSA
ncbi:cilia- and flagella-associated protein 298-B-like [Punica granatum]|nr:cilia- and flagella-associated protein 298-B-like [Punica granatum]